MADYRSHAKGTYESETDEEGSIGLIAREENYNPPKDDQSGNRTSNPFNDWDDHGHTSSAKLRFAEMLLYTLVEDVFGNNNRRYIAFGDEPLFYCTDQPDFIRIFSFYTCTIYKIKNRG